MIKSFKHKGLKKYFQSGDTSRIKQSHAKRLRIILTYLNAANLIKDVNFPGSNLHQLSGNKKGLWAVNVSGNWRIIFRFENGNAYEVDYDDYH